MNRSMVRVRAEEGGGKGRGGGGGVRQAGGSGGADEANYVFNLRWGLCSSLRLLSSPSLSPSPPFGLWPCC